MSIFSLTSSGGDADRERAQPEAQLAHLSMAVLAARRAPDRRVGLLDRLGLHPALRHRQCSPSNSYSSLVQHPTTWPMASCHMARVWRGVDAEALELGAGRRPAGAEVDPAVGDEVEHRHRLRRAHGMVVGLRHEPHAEAEPHALGAGGDGAVEHLGVRAVRELLEEVVLDRPERVPAVLLAGHRLLDRVLVGEPLAVGPPRPGDRDLVEQGEAHGGGASLSAAERGEPVRLDHRSHTVRRRKRVGRLFTDGRNAADGSVRGQDRDRDGGGVRHRAVLCRAAAAGGSGGVRGRPGGGRRASGRLAVGRPLGVRAGRRHRRGVGGRPGPLRRGALRAARRRRARGGRRRRWPRPPGRRRRVAAGDRRQPHRHVPRGQARDRPPCSTRNRSTASGARSSRSPASRGSRAPPVAAPTTRPRAAWCSSPRTWPSTTGRRASGPTPSVRASSTRP